MNVTLIPPLHIDQIWPYVADGFHRALMKTGGDMTAGELWVLARSGQGFLFVAWDGEAVRGASLWRFETWQTGAKFRCMALYGKGFRDWIEDMHQAVKAAAGGANLIAEGRPGWQPVFKKAKVLRLLYEEEN